MKVKLLFVFAFVFTNTNSQNLVNNGNFEIYSVCPNAGSQITYATGWNTASLSPDYFNSCSNTSLNVPNTAFGWQQNCQTGLGGFAGGWAFIPSLPNEGRECVQ